MTHAQCGKECGYYTYQALLEAGRVRAMGEPTCRNCGRKLRGVMIDFVSDEEVAYS